jgi:hypothetical protein
MDKNLNTLRWDPYVFVNDQKVLELWTNHFFNSNRKVLFILGKGFDVRMNIGIKGLMENCPKIDLDCWLIQFDEGSSSSSHKYAKYAEENFKQLELILEGHSMEIKTISLWSAKGKGKRSRIGDRQAAAILEEFEQIANYTDIIIDISALPRGVYFSLIGKFLKTIDFYCLERPINLMISVAENAAIDSKIMEREVDDDIGYLQGFGGNLELTSEMDEPTIWFPILGEDKIKHLGKAFSHIMPDEICPILPFPSKDPRRSDSLIIDYHKWLFDELNIQPQNLMYVPEQNPFDAYVRMTKAIRNFHNSLSSLNGCKVVISTFSSKVLSIATLLTAYELMEDIGVGVLNVDSQGYEIDDFEELKNLRENSELFVIWLTGEPYDENTKL